MTSSQSLQQKYLQAQSLKKLETINDTQNIAVGSQNFNEQSNELLKQAVQTNPTKTISSNEQRSQLSPEKLPWKPHNSVHQYDPSKLQYYLASGHVTNFKFISDKLYKVAKSRQLQYYLHTQSLPYNPICYKIEQNHLILQNLLYQMPSPRVIDIKLGRHSELFSFNAQKLQARLKRLRNTSSEKLAYRISGYVTETVKQHNIKTKDIELMKEIFKKCILQKHIDKILEFIEGLKEYLGGKNRVFESTSLLIVSNNEQVKIKWIDMSYWVDHVHPDYDLIQGLDNLGKMLKNLY